MAVKDKILKVLEEHKGEAVSGQDLADRLSVSRAAIWKGIGALKEEGHLIQATQNKGYCLVLDSDVLSPQGILHELKDFEKPLQVLVYNQVDSTNTKLKELALEGGADGTVLFANEQTAGRGRRGRSFYSPKDTGLYMSFLFRPSNVHMTDALKITVGAAVAVCHSIEAFSEKKASIKWVNDIFIEDKKVCGILTEAGANFENGTVDYLIVGIGINLKTENFPQEIKNVAASVFPKAISRNQFGTAIIRNMYEILPQLGSDALMEEYRNRSCLLGKDVVYEEMGTEHQGRAVAINEEGHLIVEKSDGAEYALQWGEVRVKKA